MLDCDRESVTQLGTLDEQRPRQRIGLFEAQVLQSLARLEFLVSESILRLDQNGLAWTESRTGWVLRRIRENPI